MTRERRTILNLYENAALKHRTYYQYQMYYRNEWQWGFASYYQARAAEAFKAMKRYRERFDACP